MFPMILGILCQRFFFKSQVIGASKLNIGKCDDFVWVTKDELLEYFPENAEFLNKMIINWYFWENLLFFILNNLTAQIRSPIVCLTQKMLRIDKLAYAYAVIFVRWGMEDSGKAIVLGVQKDYREVVSLKWNCLKLSD